MYLVSNVVMENNCQFNYLANQSYSAKDNGYLSELKSDIIQIFNKLEFNSKSKASKCIQEITNSVAIENVIDNVNKYLSKSNGTERYKIFTEEVKLLIDNKKLEIGDKYDFVINNGGCYEFAKKHHDDPEMTCVLSELDESVKYSDLEAKNKRMNILKLEKEISEVRQKIEQVTNKNSALMDLHEITYELLSIYNKTFNKLGGIKTDDGGYVQPKNPVSDSRTFSELKTHLDKLNSKNKTYEVIVNSNMNSLPTICDELKYLENKNIPDMLQAIKPAKIEIILSEAKEPNSESTWRRIVNAIAKFLSPSLFVEIENKKQSWDELIKFAEQLTKLKEKNGYENVHSTPWVYHLACQLLDKCVPPQYPFDPLNLFSADRRVWLTLQKEWRQPLESNS